MLEHICVDTFDSDAYLRKIKCILEKNKYMKAHMSTNPLSSRSLQDPMVSSPVIRTLGIGGFRAAEMVKFVAPRGLENPSWEVIVSPTTVFRSIIRAQSGRLKI